MTIGEQIIDAIIKGNLFRMECAHDKEHGCVAIWSANAPEQLTALARNEDEASQAYRTLGRVAELADEMLQWVWRQQALRQVQGPPGMEELADYLENVRPHNVADVPRRDERGTQ